MMPTTPPLGRLHVLTDTRAGRDAVAVALPGALRARRGLA